MPRWSPEEDAILLLFHLHGATYGVSAELLRRQFHASLNRTMDGVAERTRKLRKLYQLNNDRGAMDPAAARPKILEITQSLQLSLDLIDKERELIKEFR